MANQLFDDMATDPIAGTLESTRTSSEPPEPAGEPVPSSRGQRARGRAAASVTPASGDSRRSVQRGAVAPELRARASQKLPRSDASRDASGSRPARTKANDRRTAERTPGHDHSDELAPASAAGSSHAPGPASATASGDAQRAAATIALDPADATAPPGVFGKLLRRGVPRTAAAYRTSSVVRLPQPSFELSAPPVAGVIDAGGAADPGSSESGEREPRADSPPPQVIVDPAMAAATVWTAAGSAPVASGADSTGSQRRPRRWVGLLGAAVLVAIAVIASNRPGGTPSPAALPLDREPAAPSHPVAPREAPSVRPVVEAARPVVEAAAEPAPAAPSRPVATQDPSPRPAVESTVAPAPAAPPVAESAAQPAAAKAPLPRATPLTLRRSDAPAPPPRPRKLEPAPAREPAHAVTPATKPLSPKLTYDPDALFLKP